MLETNDVSASAAMELKLCACIYDELPKQLDGMEWTTEFTRVVTC